MLEVNRSDNDLPRRTRFWLMDAEKHFTMVAVAKFRRSLETAAKVDDRFAEILKRFPIVVEWLRNALEHDDDRGLWASTFREPYSKHEWSDEGGGRLGGQVDDGALRVELEQAFEALLQIERTRP